MARQRIIKPEFFTSPQVIACDIYARYLFIGIWIHSDDAGRHKASCLQCKMETFAGDEKVTVKKVSEYITELIDNGLLLEYQFDSVDLFWQVTGWDRNQRLDHPKIRFPSPLSEHSEIIRGTLSEYSKNALQQGKGKERKGKETARALARGQEDSWSVQRILLELRQRLSNEPALESVSQEFQRIAERLRPRRRTQEVVLTHALAALDYISPGIAGDVQSAMKKPRTGNFSNYIIGCMAKNLGITKEELRHEVLPVIAEQTGEIQNGNGNKTDADS